MKRILAFVLAISLSMTLFGCGSDKTASDDDNLPKINEIAAQYESIDEMPDWTGSDLDITVWYAYGSNETYAGKKSTDDKYRDEIKRISGITFNKDDSFDNGGSSAETRIAKMVATKTWPDVAIELGSALTTSLGEADEIWDLNEFIPECMPNYMSIVKSSPEIEKQYNRLVDNNGKRYSFNRLGNTAFRYYDKEYTEEKYSSVITAMPSRSTIWVRDDILKMIYPNALSLDEIKKIYVDRGSYTKEEVADVTVKSLDDFKNLLKKINDLNIIENGRKVWPIYTHNAGDNWDLLTQLAPVLAGSGFSDSQVSNFDYYDVEQKKIVNTLEQPWFKDMVKFFVDILNEGLAPVEALVDNSATFEQKVNNGEYAILYGNVIVPTQDQLKAAGKNFAYRKVILDIPYNSKRFAHIDTNYSAFTNYSISFFKETMTEGEVKRFLRFLDLFYTDTGTKFANWGSEKSGLHKTDESGNLVFTSEELENNMVYWTDSNALVNNGLCSFPRIDYFINADRYAFSTIKPQLLYSTYDVERKPDDYLKAWNYNFFEEPVEFPALDFKWTIWNYPKYVEGVKSFWGARQSIEDAIKGIFVAKTDAEFEDLYNKMLDVARSNGYTDECLQQMNDVLKERNNPELYEEFMKWVDSQ